MHNFVMCISYKDIMIPTAKEALEQTKRMDSKFGKKVQENVSRAIKTSIDKCKTTCTVKDLLPRTLEKNLVENGYTIIKERKKNEMYTHISW